MSHQRFIEGLCRDARKAFAGNLPKNWRCVTAGGGGILIIEAPNGKFGTLDVYQYSPGVLRLVINRTSCRRRGTHKEITPELQPQCEVSVTHIEVNQFAIWLADWLKSGLVHPPMPPEPSLPFEVDLPTYKWTDAAHRIYEDWRGLRRPAPLPLGLRRPVIS